MAHVHVQDATASAPARPLVLPVVSLRSAAPWLLLAVALVGLVGYFVGAEQGATSVFAGNAVHEWVHDARHLLGFPCH
ncbi:CbtB domain-containing protein [Terracoccus luteus]|jgi:xanthosine utilization system XapX-like protein|uniref:Xanthosine utilization system XapX-like protein n=1 Tax=Terracoccus luteus TaxID=53356 RepID=A0A839Q063_9MICO|nr:CbtB-domain containing protein [Terracoccus luteus]MBB2986442.1 xanthosine utilization system XapX-like protein [Terracoccus luteus]MCP2171969.1 xanthosine utilization system XapX-like protein [Terracoccus luteus]